MLYAAYQAQSDLMTPLRLASSMMADAIGHLPQSLASLPLVRRTAATAEVMALWGLSHTRPAFGIDSVVVGTEEVAVTEVPAHVTPFGTLLHFRKEVDLAQPPVLLVAPMSGHFSTLLRATVRTMLPEHDVYLTDWHNAREVPVSAGTFGLDGYTQHLIEFLQAIGPGAHMIAVCQPAVQALAATALMAEDDDPARPRSLTLMAGPVDGRINPTVVNSLAVERPLSWFEQNVITTVPLRFAGAGRRVYPGFLQLSGFVSMNPDRHAKAFAGLWDDVARGELAHAARTRDFYEEYFAVLDLTAEFYLETIDKVFQRYLLAKGELEIAGRLVDPAAIRDVALLTVEGERDDVCGIGQTSAAHALCTSLRPAQRREHLAQGAGHYGVFSGSRWERETYPLIRTMILASS
ncbi:MAG: poly(3-hydroxybutyrate) depolymerase [Solirubrobacteraceae bacterium]|jgi:polyhydroxyalkanoate depolymerase|nr:poly(3-hydroxybutyrate) depolymerase [Solirubrobacteraceae bacterium]